MNPENIFNTPEPFQERWKITLVRKAHMHFTMIPATQGRIALLGLPLGGSSSTASLCDGYMYVFCLVGWLLVGLFNF